ncbi:MAG TPA: MarR family winged helix-turn-helix transcriptional regulator [Phenylobacterium sp.]|jgi:DNA-binding MarR family transcriptional regulator
MDGLATVLAMLKAFRRRHPNVTLSQVIVFLCVGSTEGITVQEVADRCGLTQSAASRGLRVFGPPGAQWSLPPALGLLEASTGAADARTHAIHLSDTGRELWNEIEAIGGQGVPGGAGARSALTDRGPRTFP